MRRLVYDIETTGLYETMHDVIQFAYAIFDDDKFIKSDNLFFYYDGMSWSEEAYKVHNISLEFLKQYKDKFHDNLVKMFVALSGSTVLGFNNHHFDDPFVRTWTHRMGMPDIEFEDSIDMMKIATELFGGSRISLKNTAKKMQISDELVDKKCLEYFNINGSAHYAHYDVTKTALCFFTSQRWGAFENEKERDDFTTSSDFLDFIANNEETTLSKDYEPNVLFVFLDGMYYPTCSNAALYNNEPVSTPPEGSKVDKSEYLKTGPNIWVSKNMGLIKTFTKTPTSSIIECSLGG